MPETDSIFEKIVAGQIPCWKLYEDGLTFAFLDINPLSHGHALVIPKVCYATLDQVPAETAAALGRTVQRVGTAIAQATGCQGWNVLQNNGAAAGQEVHHVHFHIIPRTQGDGLGYRWSSGSLEQPAAESLHQAITAALDA